MKTLLLDLVWLLALTLSPVALAKASWKDLSASDFSLSPAPQQGSAVDLGDLMENLKLQDSRTSAQCHEIEAMGNAKFKDLFKASGLLSDSEYDDVKDLMKKTGKLAKKISKDFKDHFKRLRPSDEDSQIKPCDGVSEAIDYSYPSSHATVATTVSCVLATVYPHRAKAFSAYAHSIGLKRVLGGMHHPTDIAAGEQLGYDLCRQLLKDSDYQGSLDDLR